MQTRGSQSSGGGSGAGEYDYAQRGKGSRCLTSVNLPVNDREYRMARFSPLLRKGDVCDVFLGM